MAVSEMSRRSCRRRAYPLRQPPEKAEPGMKAHSARFGNFRNLPQHAKMALGASSAISGQKDAASHRLLQPARQFPTNDRLARCARAQPKRPQTLLAPCHFIFFFFPEIDKSPKAQASALILVGGGPASPPVPSPGPPSPSARAGGSENYTDFGTSATHRGAPAEGGELRRSPLRSAPHRRHRACRPLRRSVLLPSFIPSLPPFFSLPRPCTHRDKG